MFERLVLNKLITNKEFTRRVLPYLKKDYFEGSARYIFDLIVSFVVKYSNAPSFEALKIELEDRDINETQFMELSAFIDGIAQHNEECDLEWLVDKTEKWCQDRAIHNAIMESISIIDGSHKTLQKSALPELLSNALAVSFDTSIGHDYLENVEERYNFYHDDTEKLPFDLEMFNKITKGGVPRKSLSCVMSGPGVGKSTFMCHVAASMLSQGKKVLYITLEMAEERIAERIDANLMDIPVDKLGTLSKSAFIDRVESIRKKTTGRLIIKEYPTTSAHVGHFRILLKELKLKKSFVPDIIFADYMNICASSRVKPGQGANTYVMMKAIAEELRGLAVEYDLPIITGTQVNREGAKNTMDMDMTNTSESFGIPASLDLFFALINNDELEERNQILVKQLKNRYGAIDKPKHFIIGINREKMRLYDVDTNDQPSDDVQTYEVPKVDPVERNPDFSGFKI